MKTPYIFLAFLLVGFACKKSGTGSKCTPERKDYVYQTDKQIDHQRTLPNDTAHEYYSYTINTGDKYVFNFTLQFADCPELADDEGFRTIVFEIPGNVNSFQLKDSTDLRKAKALIQYGCYCPLFAPFLIKNGLIEGQKKSSNRWHLKASLIPFQNTDVDFEADFILK